jgi:hypothetical protein
MSRRLQVLAGRIWRQLGFRGAALGFFGQLDLVIAWSLVDPAAAPLLRVAPAYRMVVRLAPLPIWAGLWATVGVVCLVQALQRSDRLAFALAIAIKLLWAMLMLAAWPLGASRGWLSCEVWLTLSAFVAIIGAWPEPPTAGGGQGD